MAAHVAVLGGGVAGLTTAHELAGRGFRVTVHEAREDRFGGKARSFPGPALGSAGPLPAEHGFRFFPGFYRHLPDTMGRIPAPRGSVRDHLVDSTRIMVARAERRPELVTLTRLPSSAADLGVLARFARDWVLQARIPADEQVFFALRLLTLLASCEERRLGRWEYDAWWDFIAGDERSETFRKFLADGATRSLVAAQAREMSARTGGAIILQLLQDFLRAGDTVDRVLDGPTSDVWIDPWIAELERLGVELRLGSTVREIEFDGERIAGVKVSRGRDTLAAIGASAPDGAADGVLPDAGATERLTADLYVAAVPAEIMRALASPALRAAEPRLNGLDRLRLRWMNGIVFYLDRDVEVVHGHTLYLDSDWALTSISQQQFWSDLDLETLGDGRVEGILSVDVSDWETPSRALGKPAMHCDADEIAREVWRQIEAHVGGGEVPGITWENVVDWHLDPAIRYPNPTEATNLEPLLVNTAGSWDDRPDPVTSIPNLFLASDYVRTFTDLATMEAANEAARRAVNGILEATGSPAERCPVWPLGEPAPFAPLRALDRIGWALGLPPPTAPLEAAWSHVLRPAAQAAAARLGAMLPRR